jgi:hypothetical protein
MCLHYIDRLCLTTAIRKIWERIMVGLPGDIIRGYSDVALGNSWYKYHPIKEMKCLVTHSEDSARWFVPCAKTYPRWTSITRVFTAYI